MRITTRTRTSPRSSRSWRMRSSSSSRSRPAPRAAAAPLMPEQPGYQDMGGRVTRYPLRASEKTEKGGKLRDIQLGQRWMDAMSVDYSCLFPTGMLNIGMHPQKRNGGRAVLGLQSLGHREGAARIGRTASTRCCACRSPTPMRRCARSRRSATARASAGFMVTTVRHNPVHDNCLHEGLPGDRGARSRALLPFRLQLGRAGVPQLQPLPLGARARLLVLQHPALAPTGSSTAWASASPSCR